MKISCRHHDTLPLSTYHASPENKGVLLHVHTTVIALEKINCNSLKSVNLQFTFIFPSCPKMLFIAVFLEKFLNKNPIQVCFAFGLLKFMTVLLAFLFPSYYIHFGRVGARFFNRKF